MFGLKPISTDVAIIGAGPGGSTCGSYLRKFGDNVKVTLFERDVFPRDHVGESQLPMISRFLQELGVWEKVEAANFPIKIGATYKWGKTKDLWDFHFVPGGKFMDEPRPGKYDGQRTHTAFQVDRAIYDQILADHAQELGCSVHYNAGVKEIRRDGDRVTGLVLDDGTEVEAKVYIDASGHSGILRRAMGVGIEEPSKLRNVAFWDYWENADWAVTVGVGGTRVQVMSVGYGWLWFIPLSPTRTSIGLVCPADYYKDKGLKAANLYRQAIEDEPRIKSLITNAKPEGKFATTKDWSFVAERMAGPNWYLVGECLGFADPILAAGLTLTHTSAREAAFSILENWRDDSPPGHHQWLTEEYERRNRRRVLQHIRFADYWYTANENFSELKEYTREIARDAGLELDADKAFQWLGTGGFIEEDMGIGGIGSVGLAGLHQIANRFSQKPSSVAVDGFNLFFLQMEGAQDQNMASYDLGRVLPMPALAKNGKFLPMRGLFGMIFAGLRESPRADHLAAYLRKGFAQFDVPYDATTETLIFNCLEAMVRDGWVKPQRSNQLDAIDYKIPEDTATISRNRD